MQNLSKTITITGLVAVMSLSALVPVFAGSEGRKNTAIALTAATAYSALKKNDRAALVGALATAQAWKGYEDARKRESRQRTYSATYTRPASSTYRRTSSKPTTSRSYRPASRTYYRPASRSYTVRPAVSTSSAQVSQLKAQVAQLQAQNAEIKRQAAVTQLRAENAALKAEVAKQRTLIADAQYDKSTRTLQMGAIVLIALLAMGIASFGWMSFSFRRVMKQ